MHHYLQFTFRKNDMSRKKGQPHTTFARKSIRRKMEESNQLQSMYNIFRFASYTLLFIEIMVFVPFDFIPETPWALYVVSMFAKLPWYDNLIYSRLAVLIMVMITSIGTKAKKQIQYNPTHMVAVPLISGLLVTVVSILVYPQEWQIRFFGLNANYILYMVLAVIGTVSIHVALDNVSKFIRTGMMNDRMNWENESFEQDSERCTDKDAINIPTLYYYRGKMRRGWINIEQPFRGIWVVGVPGSGKTFGIIEPLIRQESAKGWSMCVYDYKFPVLARKLFYHFEKNKAEGKLPAHATFNVINFVNVEYSRRVNPIQNRYINSVGEASETAVTLMEALQKGKSGGGGSDDFFKKAAENFLAACIFFFVNYEVMPYDRDWVELNEEKLKGSDGRYLRDAEGNIVRKYYYKDGRPAELYRYKGRYADLPHVLSFLMQEYTTIFDVLMMEESVASLVAPFKTALQNKAMDQLEGMVGTLRIYVSRLVTPEAFWVLSGDDFDLKISDPKDPSYLLIANDPKMEAIITALNAVILNRLVSEVNTGEGKNNPVSIIVDELPTLYFNKIDRLQGTARSNKVSIALGFQSKEQLEKDYGKEVTAALLGIFGSVISATTNNKDTVEWLSNDIMGKIKQVKEGLSITKSDTTISLNEELQPLVPADKIANMPAGWLCGTTARSFTPLEMKRDGRIDIKNSSDFRPAKFFAKTDFDMKAIKAEEKQYVDLPIFYNFGSEEEKKSILMDNFRKINKEVDEMCTMLLGGDEI